ncbi:SH3 domain-containing protein [Streptomyces spectabilis]|uniref:SH3 domain-containing protein n=1 Tax=Streptomyces spectabilis TaxID=68270 RepID=UPI003403EFFF
MRSARIAASAAALGVLVYPLAAARAASASPSPAASTTLVSQCESFGPWGVYAKAVTIRSKASTNSTALGVLYRSHRFTVHKTKGNWRYITDRSTGVKGWVSAKYVHREIEDCR